jgi:hypothetical protein
MSVWFEVFGEILREWLFIFGVKNMVWSCGAGLERSDLFFEWIDTLGVSSTFFGLRDDVSSLVYFWINSFWLLIIGA